MFTGIIESLGTIQSVQVSGSNHSFWISSTISAELSIDQSLSHDGVCLTVEETRQESHRVTAVAETISVTNLAGWEPGKLVNLERCLKMNGRLDGHLVQGHVDATAICTKRTDLEGSWEFQFEVPAGFSHLMVEKGSIAINGISLTIFDVGQTSFSVAIIPYTFEHTNMNALYHGATVNLEFDIIGKYVARMAATRV